MRTHVLALSLLLSAAATTGCAVGPDYHRPDVAIPAAFIGQSALESRGASQSADIVKWWEGFNDPVLTQLETTALDQNLSLQQALARVTQSRASLRAATAALLPSAGVTGQAATNHLSEQTPLGRLASATPGFDRNGEYYEADATAAWELDLFGGLRREREGAVAGYQAAKADAAAARLTVAAQTADVYVTIRGLQTRIAIAKDQINTQQQLLSTVKLQYQKGVAARLQMSQSEGALAQVQASLPVLEDALESAQNALDVLLGSQPGTYRSLLAAPAPIPDAPAISTAAGPADLLRRRPDIIAAERRLAASNAQIGAAISDYYPKIALSGLIGTATTTGGNVFDSGANQAQGAIGLRWRLFDFGRIGAEVNAAKGRNAEALAAYRQSVLVATQDVDNAFSTLVKREGQEVILAGGEQSLTQARDSSMAAYKGGVVSLIEVLDADNRLLATRDARAQAKTETARAAIASFRALGGGWNPEAKS
jgi:NodT family efflux transporter outer membrane factor (OMF) lipoprotein